MIMYRAMKIIRWNVFAKKGIEVEATRSLLYSHKNILGKHLLGMGSQSDDYSGVTSVENLLDTVWLKKVDKLTGKTNT